MTAGQPTCKPSVQDCMHDLGVLCSEPPHQHRRHSGRCRQEAGLCAAVFPPRGGSGYASGLDALWSLLPRQFCCHRSAMMHVRLLVRTHNMGGTAVRALLVYANVWHNQGQGRSQMQTLCICVTCSVHHCAEASAVFSEEPACRVVQSSPPWRTSCNRFRARHTLSARSRISMMMSADNSPGWTLRRCSASRQ